MQAPFDIIADLDTPVSAYLKLESLNPRFLLESVEGGERLARYSFLGFGESLDVRIDEQCMTIDDVKEARPSNQQQYLDALRRCLKLAPKPQPESGLPFSGGLVGVSGYDIIRLFENIPGKTLKQSQIPDAAFVATASLLVFDHLTRRVALLHDGPETERASLRKEIIKLLRGAIPSRSKNASVSTAESSLSEEEFSNRVARCKEYIAAGDIYQIVLSVLFRGKTDIEPFEVYRALRLLNPSPYMFFFNFGDTKVVGSSPEALVKLNRDTASLRPIAGTLPRGSTEKEDEVNANNLLADPKESAEHVMLVDLARNDLGRVAEAGSIHVEPYRKIENYSHVMHIVSGVQGKLASNFDQFDLFAATFPAGTLVGAPKVRAMQIIEEMEHIGRGLYGGTAGYFGLSGDMDQAITIRTLVFSKDEYSFQAGAGIVADSVSSKEYQEVLAKSAILRSALEIAKEGL
jgi:anthranilate synthase component 1